MRIFYYCMVEYMDDQVLSTRMYLLVQGLDIVFLGGMLGIFRSR